ncbi:MAG: hypothetical protein ACLUEQ_01045 [Cloacibacillus evryensis]
MDSRHREEILRLLEQNARYTAKDIAVMLGMDVIEVKNEIGNNGESAPSAAITRLSTGTRPTTIRSPPLIELKVTPQRGEL